MSQSVLIVARDDDGFFSELEDEILNARIETVTIRKWQAAGARLRLEFFSTIIVDAGMMPNVAEFVEDLLAHPTGAVTPLVIINNRQDDDRDLFGGHKTILDQCFNQSDTPPSAVVEYIKEMLSATERGKKKGLISRVPVAFILQSAHLQSLTGSVRLSQQDEKRTLIFEDGKLVACTSSRLEQSLSTALVHSSNMTQQEVNRLEAAAKEKNLALSKVVQIAGSMPTWEIKKIETKVLKEIIFDVLTWDKGEYWLSIDADPEFEGVPTRVAIPPVLYEGIKKVYTEARLKKYFPNTSDIIVPIDELSDEVEALPLDSKEQLVVRLLDKRLTIHKLCLETPLKVFEVMQLLFTLLALGWCEVRRSNRDNTKAEMAQRKRRDANLPKVMPAKRDETDDKGQIDEDIEEEEGQKETTEATHRSAETEKSKVVDSIKSMEDTNVDKYKHEEAETNRRKQESDEEPSLTVEEKSTTEDHISIKPVTRGSEPASGMERVKNTPYVKSGEAIKRHSKPTSFLVLIFGVLIGVVLVGAGAYVFKDRLIQVATNLDRPEPVKPYASEIKSKPEVTTQENMTVAEGVKTAKSIDKSTPKKINTAAANIPEESNQAPLKTKVRHPIEKKIVASTPEPTPTPIEKVVTIDGPSIAVRVDTYLASAKTHYEEGRVTQALELYQAAYKLDPTNGDILVGLANVHYDLDQEAQAVEYLREALKRNRANAEAYLVLGNIYYFKADKVRAKRAYQAYMKYSNDSAKKQEVAKVLANL